MTFPKPGIVGRCNAVGPSCIHKPVARVVTLAQGVRFSDEVCRRHLTGEGGYLDRLLISDPNVEAIIPLPLEEEVPA